MGEERANAERDGVYRSERWERDLGDAGGGERGKRGVGGGESGKRVSAAALRVKGKLVASPGGKQAAELAVDELEVIGAADSETYPLQKKRHTLEYPRNIAHLRPGQTPSAPWGLVRNQLAYATHKFFQEHGFLYANTPIVTASDCEGAGSSSK